MKKALTIITIIFSICLVKLIYTYSVNSILINNYNNDVYEISLANMLYFLNINESYIAHYNNGNVLFQNKKYDEAIKAYERALNKKPKKERICSIRINLALSHFYNIDKNKTANILKELNSIQQILYEDNCAIKGIKIGESKKADELDDEIEKLKQQVSEEEPSEDPNNGGNNEEGQEPSSNEYEEIENQILEQQRESGNSRGGDLEYYENRNNTSYYDGKRW